MYKISYMSSYILHYVWRHMSSCPCNVIYALWYVMMEWRHMMMWWCCVIMWWCYMMMWCCYMMMWWCDDVYDDVITQKLGKKKRKKKKKERKGKGNLSHIDLVEKWGVDLRYKMEILASYHHLTWTVRSQSENTFSNGFRQAFWSIQLESDMLGFFSNSFNSLEAFKVSTLLIVSTLWKHLELVWLPFS